MRRRCVELDERESVRKHDAPIREVETLQVPEAWDIPK